MTSKLTTSIQIICCQYFQPIFFPIFLTYFFANIFNLFFCQYFQLIFLPIFSTYFFANIFNLFFANSFNLLSALWASKWYTAISHIVHYGKTGDTQLFCIQCTMGKQVIHSYFLYRYGALWVSRWYTAISHIVHYGQASGTQLFKQ